VNEKPASASRAMSRAGSKFLPITTTNSSFGSIWTDITWDEEDGIGVEKVGEDEKLLAASDEFANDVDKWESG